ncbi:hypothetical protein [Bacillus sp. SG-1]|uniref:hypothetical protein n=1 Tax=Bacillus sp. SG-1 TaxID=161544 RepID=UPI00015434DC|nr:hypothetical protein [Bacillus sp. SG-1]EDL65745.1 hypothetical protein BSG1_12761 [Bacillus sp. SG-1]EDL66528.1 hypothetical protein BSG1_04210 [Bacillus sp. SG-1]
MIDWFWLNAGSLALGLIAWTLPIVNLMRYKNHNLNNWSTFSIMSISACAISLYFQIVYAHNLVKIGALSNLIEEGWVVASSVLLIVTLLLNIITIIVYRDKTKK